MTAQAQLAPRTELTFAIVTRDRAPMLRRCLGSIIGSDLDGVSAAIVVVDDGSVDATPAVIADARSRAALPIIALQNGGEGQNAGRNLAMAHATSDLVAFIDDDETVPPNYAKLLVEVADHHRDAGAVGGPYRKMAGPTTRLCRECEVTAKSVAAAPDGSVSHLLGGNMAIRRDAFSTVGPFDPDLSGYGNETEWFHRARRAGIRLAYDERLYVDHDQSYLTTIGLLRKSWNQGRADHRFWERTGAHQPRSIVRPLRYSAHGLIRGCANGWAQALRECGRWFPR